MSKYHPDKISAKENAPIFWPATLVLGLSFLAAITIVPYYGVVHGYSWQLWLGTLIYLGMAGISITGGYHRLWSHNAYKAHPILRWYFAIFGAATIQNSILNWAAGHRNHHRYVDNDEKDPYSAGRGLWFSHIGWMLRSYKSGEVDYQNARDLQRDPIVMFQHKHYNLFVIFTNVVIPVAFGYLVGDPLGGFLMLGVLRLVLGHHTTFFINSLAHFWGSQPYTDENSARDNAVLAVLTYGEGYHNYHHLFQNDYRNGIRWFHFDPTKWLIASCSKIGLAWDLQTVSNFKIRRAMLTMDFKRAQQRLDKLNNADTWQQALEGEYQQFVESLNEWRELRTAWMESQKQKLAIKKGELLEKKDEFLSKLSVESWNQTALATRFKELEYALKMQQKRMAHLTLQISQGAAAA